MLNMLKSEYPYKECKTCKDLSDCPEPEVGDGAMSLPMIPDCCPRPIDIMKATLKKNIVRHKLIKSN